MYDTLPSDDPKHLLALGLGTTDDRQTPPWTPPAPSDLPAIPNLEIGTLLGTGGMGAVYRARQTHLERLVAVKIIDPARGADPTFAERFAREARAMARLDHPAIVHLYDYGQTGAWPWLVMELVEGANLRELLRTGKLSAAEALRIAPLLCAALAHAHAAGIIHRDLKPENILIDAQGRPHIADFGLAKLSDDRGNFTTTGEGCGTPVYMAPEQVSGAAAVDQRADLYALGVIIYEMLTGALPLGRFAPPSQTGGVDPRLDEVVMKSLEREPGRRWQSAGEMQRAVEGATAPGASEVAPDDEALSVSWRGIRLRGRNGGGFEIGWHGLRFFRSTKVSRFGPGDVVILAIFLIIIYLMPWLESCTEKPSSSADPLPKSSWAEYPLPRGARIREGHRVITVSQAGRIPLGIFSTGLPAGRTWHVHTRIRWHGVENHAMLESVQQFVDGSERSTRTLADSGPEAWFTGTSDVWREVELPFDASTIPLALLNVQLSLLMEGPGTVEVEPPQLLEGLPH